MFIQVHPFLAGMLIVLAASLLFLFGIKIGEILYSVLN